jgi:hypothetical protein
VGVATASAENAADAAVAALAAAAAAAGSTGEARRRKMTAIARLALCTSIDIDVASLTRQ